MLFIPYSTGTITLNNGETAFTGTDTAWQFALVKQYTVVVADGVIGLVESIEGEASGTLKYAWAGSDLAGVSYQMFIPVDDGIELQDTIRNFFIGTQATAVMYAVSGSEPDPSLGVDDQFAAKVNAAPWKFWKKVAGEWVYLGLALGVSPKGEWDSTTAYIVGDVTTVGGKAYYCKLPSTNNPPPSSPTYWTFFLEGGDRFDLASFDTDRPSSGELIVKIYPKDVTYYAGLSDSQAGAEVGATADAVYSITKNGVEFATLTFEQGSAVGVFACASDTSFGTGDVLRIIAPDPRDETLSGVAASIIGYR